MTDDLFATPIVTEPARAPQPVPYTWTEPWRHECEVRFVKSLTYGRRKEYLDAVAEKRGAAAAERLREGGA